MMQRDDHRAHRARPHHRPGRGGRRCGGRRAPVGYRARTRSRASRALIERVVAERIPTYGVNTGFGRFVDVHIEPDQVTELQLNLLRSHACGVGDPFPVEVVRAAMLLRANALAKGSSGVRLETVQLLLDLLARRRASGGAVARFARRQRRPGPARPPRPGAGRRGLRHGRRARWSPAAEALRGAGLAAARAGRQGGAGADQRHPVHVGDRRPRAVPRAAAGEGRRPRRGPVDRGGQGLAHAVCARASGAAAPPGSDRVGREPLPAARRLPDRGLASLVRPGAGRLLVALLAAGARRGARRHGLRRTR